MNELQQSTTIQSFRKLANLASNSSTSPPPAAELAPTGPSPIATAVRCPGSLNAAGGAVVGAVPNYTTQISLHSTCNLHPDDTRNEN